jgi:ATP-binding cassette subfamily C (CFTR/MRP) protein 1
MDEQKSSTPSLPENDSHPFSKAAKAQLEEKQHIQLQFDLGEEHARFRTKWWQLWYVPVELSFVTSYEPHLRVPRNPPPPPRSSLADAPVVDLRITFLVAIVYLDLSRSSQS